MRKFVLFVLSTFLTVGYIVPLASAGGGHAHDSAEKHEGDAERGPNGGRLFHEGEFSLELLIFESGVPPQFRVYAYEGGKLVPPEGVEVTVEISRLNREKQTFVLRPQGKYQYSIMTVVEPHSFTVAITAAFKAKRYSWSYDSHEGRVELSDAALRVAGLSIETAGAQGVANVVEVYGRLLPNEDRVAHITPRFPGIVKEIRKELGDKVEKGELLAIVESNQSLQPYELRSSVAGELIARHATVGEFVSGVEDILVVADLSSVWADFQVYRDDAGNIEKGQRVSVHLDAGESVDATVRYVSPVTDSTTQSKLIRALIPNPEGKLRPGLFVTGTLSGSVTPVAVAVRREAIQTFRDWDVVYLTDGHSFQAMPVRLGRKDSTFVEILSGIVAGDRYVAKNSFIIKADIEKSGASHDH